MGQGCHLQKDFAFSQEGGVCFRPPQAVTPEGSHYPSSFMQGDPTHLRQRILPRDLS